EYYEIGAVPGHVSSMPDASVAVEVFTGNNQIIGDAQTVSTALRLVTLHPDGTTATTMLRQSSCGFDCIEFYVPGEIAPDGHDGLLATWSIFGTGISIPSSSHVTHVDAVGGTNDVTMPFHLSGVDTGSVILGENNQAFIYDPFKLVAFDVNSGLISWSWQVPQDSFMRPVAALSGGGVLVKQVDGNTGQEQIIRFDSQANITYN